METGENQNNSHSESSVQSKSRKLNEENDKSKIRGKKELMTAKENRLAHKSNFREDDETVDMEVQGNITSDGEDDDSASESEGEISDGEPGRQMDGENTQIFTESEASQNDSTDEEEAEQSRLNEKWKRKIKQRERRACMEEKLDSLATTLQAMQ